MNTNPNAPPVEEHCELLAAAENPEEVRVCLEDGACFLVDHDLIDVSKFSLEKDEVSGKFVLVPDHETGHLSSCHVSGHC